jgi:hypothetical protein
MRSSFRGLMSLAVLCGYSYAQPSFTITTSSPLPSGLVGTAYSVQLAATPGFPTPYTWSIGSGSLPAGLSLSAAGLISGTPTNAGTSTTVINAASAPINGVTSSSRKQFVLTILAISPSTLQSGTTNAPYSQTLTASGGQAPYTWSARGLPTGLNIGSSTGVISGTPTSPGSFTVSVTVVDSTPNAPNAARANYALTIASDLRITTTSIPANNQPQVGVAYTQSITASGGVPPYSFSATGLPPGLSINGSTGAIGGTPSVPGTDSFAVKVTDSQFSAVTQVFTVTVTTPITFLTANIGNGTVGVPYSQQVNATGGAPPLVYSLAQSPFGTTPLPPGLILSSTGGITGTPTTIGTYSVTIVATDSINNSGSKIYMVTISAPQGPLQVSPTALTFNASSAGASPASQIITVISGNTTSANFTVTEDGGQANTPAPSWLAVTPSAGITPAVLTVSVNPSGLSAGSYSGRILVSGTGTAAPTAVAVTLTVAAAIPKLSVAPGFVRFAGRVQAPGLLDQMIVVTNAGGSGALSFSVAALNPIPWLDSITPNSGQTSPGS